MAHRHSAWLSPLTLPAWPDANGQGDADTAHGAAAAFACATGGPLRRVRPRRIGVLALNPRAAAIVIAAALWGTCAQAQTQSLSPIEMGKREYQSACASCHGIDGRGDGPMRPFLSRPPADLTTLAARHGGSFPKSLIADLIDGRGIEGPGPHGSRDMPIWGQVYREESDWRLRGVPFPAEWSVRGRILSLVEYLGTLQRY